MHGVLPAGSTVDRAPMAGTQSRFTTRSFCQNHGKDVLSRGWPVCKTRAEYVLNFRVEQVASVHSFYREK